jgi:amidase
MTTHRFKPAAFHGTLGGHAAVMSVRDGDFIITETLDAHGFDKHMVKRGGEPNPMTGPFYVEGAEPGDVLAVEIVRISMNRKTGWTRSGLAWNVVDPSLVRDMPARDKTLWDIGANGVTLQNKMQGLENWSVPMDPMIGCFGVAPAGGEAISTATSGPHGGNIDYRLFRMGTTAMFPVSAAGALFFLGDVHAAQGDGEIAGTGIETSAEVEVRVRIIKNKTIGWPRGETADAIFTVGNARPLEQALQHATTEMLIWLEEDYGLDKRSASHLLGMAVRYDIANVFNPAFSVACRIEKSWLP